MIKMDFKIIPNLSVEFIKNLLFCKIFYKFSINHQKLILLILNSRIFEFPRCLQLFHSRLAKSLCNFLNFLTSLMEILILKILKDCLKIFIYKVEIYYFILTIYLKSFLFVHIIRVLGSLSEI